MYRPQRRDAALYPQRAGALPVFERQKPLRSHFIRRGGYALPDLYRPPALPQLFFGAHGDWRWPLLRGGRAPHFDQAGEDNARRDGRGELDEEGTALLTLRDHLFAIAQNREEPINQRMEQILSACGAHVPDVPLVHWAEFYLSLERMDEAWTGILEALREHADELPLDDFAAHMKGRETEYEQLLVYFLYRHVPTALDDGDVSSKAAFAVLSVRLLFSLGALHLCCTASSRWRIRSSSAGCTARKSSIPTIIWMRSSTHCCNKNAARFDTGRHFLRFWLILM